MINFSTLKSLTIPEGKVKQILDSNGSVLWSIKLVSIAVTTPPTKIQYQEGEVFDPTGMVVTATYSNGETKTVSNYTVLNGNQISKDAPTVTISYTENGVTATTAYEVEFAVTVTIKGDDISDVSTYVQINGTQYSDSETEVTLAVPVGTEIYCYAHHGGMSKNVTRIYLNSTIVATNTGAASEYTYTVAGNVTVEMKEVDGYNGIAPTSYIYITEE